MPAPRRPRDYRLDFFRGLALFFIFMDHIPDNALSYLTLRSFALSDAAEVFIFISGLTAGLVYGRALLREGAVMATAHVWRRVWQLYVAHLCLFMLFNAEVSYTVSHSTIRCSPTNCAPARIWTGRTRPSRAFCCCSSSRPSSTSCRFTLR